MKKIITFCTLLALLSFSSPALAANPDPDLVILYTGDTIGHVEPRG
jgi:hypothetical protein